MSIQSYKPRDKRSFVQKYATMAITPEEFDETVDDNGVSSDPRRLFHRTLDGRIIPAMEHVLRKRRYEQWLRS